jgi:hypothetical protein
LPQRSLGARQSSDAETVQLHQLARVLDVDVALRRVLFLDRLIRSGVAGDETETLGLGVEPVAPEHLVDPVGRDLETTPLGASELVGDALGTYGRVRQGEAENPLLDQRRGGIGHARTAALSRVQDL